MNNLVNPRVVEKIISQLFYLVILYLCFGIFSAQATSAGPTEEETPSKTLVVVYSYTGNTKAVADIVIKRFKADVLELKANRYDGFAGGLKANSDAWDEVKITDIEPTTVDMSKYDLIFLGSPIWWYRPAVPLWTFAEKNSFSGNRVVLFNTFNSKFKSDYIDEFKKIVSGNGGKFIDHIFVRRGRWFDQLSTEEMLQEFKSILNKKNNYAIE